MRFSRHFVNFFFLLSIFNFVFGFCNTFLIGFFLVMTSLQGKIERAINYFCFNTFISLLIRGIKCYFSIKSAIPAVKWFLVIFMTYCLQKSPYETSEIIIGRFYCLAVTCHGQLITIRYFIKCLKSIIVE